MPITRRRLAGATLSLTTLPLAIPYIAQAARRSLTIGALGGVFQDNYTAAVVEPFRRAHPELDISYYPAGTPEQLLSLLRSPRTVTPIDVVLLELTVAKTASSEGLLTPIARGSLPVLAELPDSAFVEGVAGPAALLDCLAIAYAPQRIRPPPTSWRFLWEKSLAGKIALDRAPDSDAIAFTLVANALYGGDDYRESLSAGINAIGSLAPGVATWYPIPDMLRAIIAGTVAVGVDWNARGQMLARGAGDRLAMALPVEGSVFQVTTINLTRDAQHADIARSFIDHALGAEAQKATAERLFFTPVHPRAELSAEALERTASAPERRERMMEVDWLAVAAMRDNIAREWRRRINTNG